MEAITHRILYRALLLVFAALVCPLSLADTATLSVSPVQCISLHQGQMCYQTLTFNWQTPTAADYCLWADNYPEPLICWHGREQQTFELEFKSRESVVYSIRHQDQSEALIQVAVEVASVYRAPRRSTSSWRLF